MKSSALPQWELAALYDGVEDAKYVQLKRSIEDSAREFTALLQGSDFMQMQTAEWLTRCIELYNQLGDAYEQLDAFITMWYTTNTTDPEAMAELNALEDLGLEVQKVEVMFKNSLASVADKLSAVYAEHPELAEYRYFLEEQLFFQQHQMSVEEEALAADLMRSGGNAWSRLFQSVSSTASTVWPAGKQGGPEKAGAAGKPAGEQGGGETKTVTELRGLAFDADRKVRRTAWQKELEAVEQVELPLAAAMNGVKGFTVSLNRRRGYASALEKSVRQARISRKTLDALIGVMEESLPVFREYLKGKARLLGQDRLAFYDLFAPVGSEMSTWTYTAGRDFILDYFRSFSDELADFAARAFEQGWIDAQPRSGKVGGAYCISLPVSGETRILCNFSGNFGDVKTIAHELGHAYHHHVLRDAPHIFRQYPMTLAETASIFAESVVIDGALKNTAPDQKLPIVEKLLQDSTQVIVDILSRFKFEREVMTRREKGELSPEELKELMLQAQRDTYGDALEKEELHPYMWAVKPHYYSPELAYYNFPYAFGHLFGLGLYNRYQQEGQAFLPVYRNLLQQTGKQSAVEVTAAAGFDIETPAFWRAGIETIKGRVGEFLALL